MFQLRKDFEEDKQQAVSRAMGKLQGELEKVRRQTEEKCRDQYRDEMKKLAQKHKETISQTKKKQWVRAQAGYCIYIINDSPYLHCFGTLLTIKYICIF